MSSMECVTSAHSSACYCLVLSPKSFMLYGTCAKCCDDRYMGLATSNSFNH